MESTGEYDFVVVGSGAAGSVLAARLAEDRNITVCVLEAGPKDDNRYIHIPAGFIKTLQMRDINWTYETEASTRTDDRRVAMPRGRTLGGSTSINGHIYSRGLPSDYDQWRNMGNPGWSFDDILPYFKRSETRLGEGDDHYRGRDGPMHVTDTNWKHPLCDAFLEGAGELDIPAVEDYNGASQAGVSYTQRMIHKGRRVSAFRAFLKPMLSQHNLEVRTNCLVTRLTLEDRVATGVEYESAGRRYQVRARREVLVCGGAINSPQLLQLSGIGDGTLLNRIGVPIVHDLPAVGENLRDHYAVRMTAVAKDVETINERSRGLKLVSEIVRYYLGKPSILGLPSTTMYAFWHSDPATRSADIQISFTPASYRQGVQSQLDVQPGMSFATWQQRPESLGYVRSRSADPGEHPEIQPNYLDAETDQKTLLAGMRLAQNMMSTAPMQRYVDRQQSPMLHIDDDDELLTLAEQRGTTAFHVMGTCRMGMESDRTTVVGPNLKVHGIDNLRVVDASVMPTMPSCNTCAPTIMIAEKAADLVRQSDR